jgi:hypothetical protein
MYSVDRPIAPYVNICVAGFYFWGLKFGSYGNIYNLSHVLIVHLVEKMLLFINKEVRYQIHSGSGSEMIY